MNVQSLLPTNALKAQQNASKAILNKWEKTGLLEGLNSEFERSGIAVLLENQAKQLVTEANATGTASNSEEWAGVALPLVRRIFAEIAAKEFVSVQPMALPSGLVFYLDFKYGTAQPGFSTGAGRTSQQDSVFGVTDASRGTATGYEAPFEGLYGAGRFGYSINEASASIATNGASVGSTVYSTGSSAATDADFNYDTQFSASLTPTQLSYLTKITIATSSLSGFDPEAIRSFVPSNAGFTTVFPQFTKYTSTTKSQIQFIVLGTGTPGASGAITGALTVKYSKQPTSITRGDFEEGNTQNSSVAGADLNIPEMNLELRSEAIVAKTRKLKAVWSPEFAQDLNAYHSIDAEAELTSMLSEYISQEIDLEILGMLINNAQTTEYWSARIGYSWNGSSFSFDTNTYAQAYNQGTWFQTLGTKIQKVSNKIHQLTMRGGANFVVCSPTVATILESIPGYAADTNGDKMNFAMGVSKVGAINNRFTVYKNPYMTENLILMGFRGSQFLETGAVYAPYIPLMMTPLVYDPTNFTPRKGVMTRYAKKVTRPEFYGKIFVEGLTRI
jgi:hypothetical protein